ncbi:uncharacterized protein CMU_024560 [Cryptosporidium muris RN66]|uniref:Uncharacterized protein n=1 Tax=Cryptosporidium muris (strain RN66) TaxID=441375 RepID=B6AAP8_CRYMR|nr:uncharacterized protein CMU_024560 [Cryptosporidium muris RN66]EEA05450.1 hypothetical protein CMU_024560 [Cryptosporidium muris RN66]|eukprot:XP_002139799.1 hypothetical protein [Cryptosporidium muris RN66]
MRNLINIISLLFGFLGLIYALESTAADPKGQVHTPEANIPLPNNNTVPLVKEPQESARITKNQVPVSTVFEFPRQYYSAYTYPIGRHHRHHHHGDFYGVPVAIQPVVTQPVISKTPIANLTTKEPIVIQNKQPVITDKLPRQTLDKAVDYRAEPILLDEPDIRMMVEYPYRGSYLFQPYAYHRYDYDPYFINLNPYNQYPIYRTGYLGYPYSPFYYRSPYIGGRYSRRFRYLDDLPPQEGEFIEFPEEEFESFEANMPLEGRPLPEIHKNSTLPTAPLKM